MGCLRPALHGSSCGARRAFCPSLRAAPAQALEPAWRLWRHHRARAPLPLRPALAPRLLDVSQALLDILPVRVHSPAHGWMGSFDRSRVAERPDSAPISEGRGAVREERIAMSDSATQERPTTVHGAVVFMPETFPETEDEFLDALGPVSELLMDAQESVANVAYAVRGHSKFSLTQAG